MTPYRDLIERAAAVHELDPNLVESVVLAESGGFTDGFRFEPGFFTRYLKGKPEYAGMNPRRISSSYGLMQVMFTTAQQYGFAGPPEHLFVPEIGLEYGCRHLAQMLQQNHEDVRLALASYNGGLGNKTASAPQRYATRVLALLTVAQAHSGDVRA